MIKTLAIFEKNCALNAKGPISAIHSGAARHGIQIVNNSMHADACLIWSVLWNGRMLPNKELYEHYRSQQKPVIIVDVGALKRNITWKVAVNHITAQGHYGHNINLDYDRPRKLGLEYKRRHIPNDKIIVMGQHAKSLSILPYVSQEEFFNISIKKLREHTDRTIVIRPHPRSKINPADIFPGVELQLPRAVVNTYDDFDANYQYHLIVNHNSGPGIQASLAGAPVLVDSTSLAYPVSISIDQIETPQLHDKDEWLVAISHTEYTTDELATGVWVTRLLKWIN